ncbi:NAD(P)/FAD-dependent oxidoreductase [Brevibacterium yomogidense]|uniref:NAD(P)/FAD-dependent oxidoreductase n=1 Tax=Brevibacterium yomogidense TaxID=946573 RepID=UPI0018DF8038|nr:NAD(P)/FAD-dependent oxidoreductase [Brevibacterium yomogidense]
MTTTSTPAAPETYDVVVIGGGAAGLSAALTLGRALRSVLVIDAGHPRNAPAAGAHNLLGNEGITPLELIARGQDEARSYGAHITTGTVTDVTGTVEDGFTVSLDAEAPRTSRRGAPTPALAEAPATVRARRIVLASGAVDTLPPIPGLLERWGKDVIHCPYCHGYEVRGQQIGVLATSPMWLHQAKLIRQWSDDVTVLLDSQPAPSAEDRAALESRGIRIVEGTVGRVLSADDRLTGVEVAGIDGPLPLEAILVGTQMSIDSALVTSLGLHTEENPMGEFVPVDMRKATNVPGVFAAGNVTSVGSMVAASMADGVMAGAALNMDLVEEDFAHALIPA